MAFNRELSLELDNMENLKQRITDMEKEIATIKEYRVEKDLLSHIVALRERVEVLESSATQ